MTPGVRRGTGSSSRCCSAGSPTPHWVLEVAGAPALPPHAPWRCSPTPASSITHRDPLTVLGVGHEPGGDPAVGAQRRRRLSPTSAGTTSDLWTNVRSTAWSTSRERRHARPRPRAPHPLRRRSCSDPGRHRRRSVTDALGTPLDDATTVGAMRAYLDTTPARTRTAKHRVLVRRPRPRSRRGARAASRATSRHFDGTGRGLTTHGRMAHRKRRRGTSCSPVSAALGAHITERRLPRPRRRSRRGLPAHRATVALLVELGARARRRDPPHVPTPERSRARSGAVPTPTTCTATPASTRRLHLPDLGAG